MAFLLGIIIGIIIVFVEIAVLLLIEKTGTKSFKELFLYAKEKIKNI